MVECPTEAINWQSIANFNVEEVFRQKSMTDVSIIQGIIDDIAYGDVTRCNEFPISQQLPMIINFCRTAQCCVQYIAPFAEELCQSNEEKDEELATLRAEVEKLRAKNDLKNRQLRHLVDERKGYRQLLNRYHVGDYTGAQCEVCGKVFEDPDNSATYLLSHCDRHGERGNMARYRETEDGRARHEEFGRAVRERLRARNKGPSVDEGTQVGGDNLYSLDALLRLETGRPAAKQPDDARERLEDLFKSRQDIETQHFVGPEIRTSLRTVPSALRLTDPPTLPSTLTELTQEEDQASMGDVDGTMDPTPGPVAESPGRPDLASIDDLPLSDGEDGDDIPTIPAPREGVDGTEEMESRPVRRHPLFPPQFSARLQPKPVPMNVVIGEQSPRSSGPGVGLGSGAPQVMGEQTPPESPEPV